MTKLIFIFLCFLVVLSTSTTEGNREISCTVYGDKDLELVYVKSTGEEDIIHYIWSSYRLPSVIVSKTTNDTELVVNLEKIRSFSKKALQFSKKPLSIIGFTISEVYELTYDSDTAEVTDSSSVHRLSLEDFEWSPITNSTFECSNALASLSLKSSSLNEAFEMNGSFSLQFSATNEETTAADFPHLIYTGNSSQIRVVLDNLFFNNSRTRYGLELMMHSIPSYASCETELCEVIREKSISDEFSPGIFVDVDVYPQCQPKSTFLTWRPVVYTSKEPNIANSSDAKIVSNCSEQHGSLLPRSVSELYFNDHALSFTDAFNVTFGTKGDGFYSKTKYTVWSLMIGTGSPLHAKLSIPALIWVCVGLISLGMFFFIGAVFLAVKATCGKKIKDDEASLLNGSTSTTVNS